MEDQPTHGVALALQGGGAHGAFTWGVLDKLLEEGLTPDAICGVSSGAIIGTMLAQGMCARWTYGRAGRACAILARHVARRIRSARCRAFPLNAGYGLGHVELVLCRAGDDDATVQPGGN